jgi:hypothetical protein
VDGPVVVAVRAGGDSGRGTWRVAELKASRGAGDLGKARPGEGAASDGTRHGRRGGRVRASGRRGAHDVAARGAVGSKMFHITPVRK